MPRRIRIQDPDFIYFVTNTCLGRMFLLAPGKELNDIFRRRLRQAVRVHGVELYAAVCMGNHFHLIVRCPKMNLSRFMGYFQGLLARDVIKLRGLEEYSVFPSRYSAEPILDSNALAEKLRYVVMNPVSANVVDHPEEYPGYTSWNQHVGRSESELAIEHAEEPPPITPAPFWRDLSADELRHAWEELVEDQIAEIRKDPSRRSLGPERALRTNYWERPKQRRQKKDARGRTRQPRAHASSIELWQTFVAYADHVTDQYRSRTAKLRLREFESFPYGTIPPGWQNCECETRRTTPRRCRVAQAISFDIAA